MLRPDHSSRGGGVRAIILTTLAILLLAGVAACDGWDGADTPYTNYPLWIGTCPVGEAALCARSLAKGITPSAATNN